MSGRRARLGLDNEEAEEEEGRMEEQKKMKFSHFWESSIL